MVAKVHVVEVWQLFLYLHAVRTSSSRSSTGNQHTTTPLFPTQVNKLSHTYTDYQCALCMSFFLRLTCETNCGPLASSARAPEL